MDLFEKNIDALKNFRPELSTLVLNHSDGGDAPKIIQLDDASFDIITPSGLKYQGKAGTLFQNSINNVDLRNCRLPIFYGLGLGYHLEELLTSQAFTKFKQTIFIEENIQYFKHILEHVDLTELISDASNHFIIGISKENLQGVLFDLFDKNRELILYLNNMIPIVTPCTNETESEYYLNCANHIKTIVNKLCEVITYDTEDAYRGFMNIMDNIQYSTHISDISHLKGKFKNVTGVIVSSGPSLNKTINILKKYSDSFLIICADSSLKPLLSHGIQPHFVGCIERVPETQHFFSNLEDIKTTLICDPVIHPKSYQNYKGPVLHAIRPIAQLRWFYPATDYHFGGQSVANYNFSILNYLGCENILLFGQDFAFSSKSKATHVDGIPQFLEDYHQKERVHIENNIKNSETFKIASNNNDFILTNKWLSEFRTAFSHQIRQSSCKVYNIIPKDFGALIPGAIRIDPEDIPTELLQNKCTNYFKQIHKAASENSNQIKSNLLQIITKVKSALKNLEQIRLISLEILDALSLYSHEYRPNLHGSDNYQPLFRKIESTIDDMWGSEDSFFNLFFVPLVQDKIVPLTQLTQSTTYSDLDEVEKTYKKIELTQQLFKSFLLQSSRMENFINNWVQNKLQMKGSEQVTQI